MTNPSDSHLCGPAPASGMLCWAQFLQVSVSNVSAIQTQQCPEVWPCAPHPVGGCVYDSRGPSDGHVLRSPARTLFCYTCHAIGSRGLNGGKAPQLRQLALYTPKASAYWTRDRQPWLKCKHDRWDPQAWSTLVWCVRCDEYAIHIMNFVWKVELWWVVGSASAILSIYFSI